MTFDPSLPRTVVPIDGTTLIAFDGPGSLVLDFGAEYPAWFEADLDQGEPAELTFGVSEHLGPMEVNVEADVPLKVAAPQRDGRTLRLDLNPDLVEGVRFATVTSTSPTPLRLSNPRLVMRSVDVQVAAFEHESAREVAIWRAGVDTLVNHMRPDHLSALLVDRGDRFAWSLDYHCAQRALLTVAGNAELARDGVAGLRGIDHGIYSYRLYWVHSVLDLVAYTGDLALFAEHVAECRRIVDDAAAQFADLPGQLYVGIDERLGAAFEEPDLPEARRYVQALIVETVSRLAAASRASGDDLAAAELDARARALESGLRDAGYPSEWGIPSLSRAIVAGIPTDRELEALRLDPRWASESAFSPSPPAQIVIVEALTRLGLHDRADEVIDGFWGGQLDQGGTNYFECFRPFWATDLRLNEKPPGGPQGVTSLSHAWGSVISAWLSEKRVGVLSRFGDHLILARDVPHAKNFRGSVQRPSGPVEVVRDERGRLVSVIPADAVDVVETPLEPAVEAATAPTVLPRSRVVILTEADTAEQLRKAVLLGPSGAADLAAAAPYLREVRVRCGVVEPDRPESFEGGIRTGSSRWDQYCLTIDLRLEPGRVYDVGLIIAAQELSASQSVEFFDLTTREPLDQGSIVRLGGSAARVSIRVTGDVRIRCGHHHGRAAVATAVTVDVHDGGGVSDS